MLESKLQKTAEELKKQNLQVESLRAVLQKKSEEERKLFEANRNLQEKVEIVSLFW